MALASSRDAVDGTEHARREDDAYAEHLLFHRPRCARSTAAVGWPASSSTASWTDSLSPPPRPSSLLPNPMAGTLAVARRPPRLAHPHVRRPFLFARSQRRVRAQLRMIPPGPATGTQGDPPRNQRGASATRHGMSGHLRLSCAQRPLRASRRPSASAAMDAHWTQLQRMPRDGMCEWG